MAFDGVARGVGTNYATKLLIFLDAAQAFARLASVALTVMDQKMACLLLEISKLC